MSAFVALPGHVTLQRAGPDSAPLIASLVNAHSLNLVGTRRALIDDDGDLRLARYMPGSAEVYIGYIGRAAPSVLFYLVARPPHVVVELGCTLLPGFNRAAPAALAWLEGRARELAAAAPEDARMVMQCLVLSADATLAAALAERGFAGVRR